MDKPSEAAYAELVAWEVVQAYAASVARMEAGRIVGTGLSDVEHAEPREPVDPERWAVEFD